MKKTSVKLSKAQLLVLHCLGRIKKPCSRRRINEESVKLGWGPGGPDGQIHWVTWQQRATGSVDPVVRKEYEKKSGKTTLIGLGLVRVVAVDVDGSREELLEITSKGMSAIKGTKPPARRPKSRPKTKTKRAKK